MSDNTDKIALPAVMERKGEKGELVRNQLKITSRRDLACSMEIPLRRLAEVLYEGKRGRHYTVREIPKAYGGSRTLHARCGGQAQAGTAHAARQTAP